MKQKQYIMIGTNIIAKDAFKKILRPLDNYSLKPVGGFYASPHIYNAYKISDWFDYLMHDKLNASFRDINHGSIFTLKDNAKILTISSHKEVLALADKYPSYHHILNYYDTINPANTIFDFEELSKYYDGIYVDYNKLTRESKTIAFTSWNVNTLLLFNLDCIQEYQSAFINIYSGEDYCYPIIEEISDPKQVIEHSSYYLDLYEYVETIFQETIFQYQDTIFKDYDQYLETLVNCVNRCISFLYQNKAKTIDDIQKILKEQEVTIEKTRITKNLVENYLANYLRQDKKRIITLPKSLNKKLKNYKNY